MDIRHVRGKVRSYRTNGKIERFFRTFKLWARAALLPIDPRAMQRRLDTFGEWYNTQRPHSALAGRTPDEAWRGIDPPEPIPIYARDPVEPIIGVERESYRDDPHLPVIEIDARLRLVCAA